MLTFSPLHINTSWYGILGLIGWAYLAGAVLFLIFRTNRTALLACVALMTCFFAAGKNGFFDNFWPAQFVDFGGTLGSQAAITVAGLAARDHSHHAGHGRLEIQRKIYSAVHRGLCLCRAAGQRPLRHQQRRRTPSWCLWADAVTAALWLGFYFFCDVKPVKFIARPLATAGQNVLLAYLLSEMQESIFDLLHLGDWYDSLAEGSLAAAIARSVGCGIVILLLTAGLNRIGFRLKL